MTLENGTLLYHGSYAEVSRVDLGPCSPKKDFGRGLYLTTDEGQAIAFVPRSIQKAASLGRIPRDFNQGYVSVFKFNPGFAPASIFEFVDADVAWLKFIASNRRGDAEILRGVVHAPDMFEADIIAGKIANDATNAVLQAYLSGVYGDVC
jgi:hypothetical protein